MDKRTLIFVACMSISFYAIQSFFGPDPRSHAAHEQRISQEKASLQAQVEARKAPLASLPLTPLFSDEAQTEKLGYGAACGKSVLALSWTDRLPATIYTPSLGKLDLATQSHKRGEPVIYAKGKPRVFETPAIPQDAPQDLHLLTASLDPRVILGQQRGQDFVLISSDLHENAIAFLQNGQGYTPVGVFDSARRQVRPLSDFERLRQLVQQAKIVPNSSVSPSGEQFFVLENEYQQLVFSNRGGALAEINLPLKSAEYPNSLVKEIEPDRLILKNSPVNSRFPLYSAATPNGSGTSESSEGGYYPLLRRSILNEDGSTRQAIDPRYYAFVIAGEDPNAPVPNYRMVRMEPNLIQFEMTQPNRRIVKTFRIPSERTGPYCLELTVQIDGDANGLWLSSGVPEVELLSGSFSPLLKYQVTQGGSSDVEIAEPSDKTPIVLLPSITPNWISNSNGFLGTILDPIERANTGYRANKIPGSQVPTRLSLIDAAHRLYPVDNYPGYASHLALKGNSTENFRIFAGPFDTTLLKQLDVLYAEPLKHYNPDYANAQSIQGWFSFISEPFAKLLDFLLGIFYAITGSWGFSIILLTIALKVMMYPLNNWSIRSMAKMQELSPKIQAVQDRYKKDPKKAQTEIALLYREHSINPVSGCLPMLLQIPFLFGMFYVLKSSFPLRGASFIPGWIDNLSAPDVLFSWSQPIFLIGTQFHLLPLLMGLTMFWQQKFTAATTPPSKQTPDAQKQQKLMGNMMAILFTVMFYNMPSGLNLYFMSSTLLGILQQWYVTKYKKPMSAGKS